MMTQTRMPLARKFEILFDTFPGPDGSPYTLTEISNMTGIAINTLSRLKTGRIEDPRLSTLTMIAEVFRISLDYFLCQTEEACYQFLQDELERRATVPQIALRVREMSDDVLAEVSKMISYIERLQDEEDSADTMADTMD